MDTDDLYKRLDVDKKASTDTLKKAYKKAALKWHPDRNTHQKELATEKFKKISEAYEILIDPQKRQLYDRVGLKNMKSDNFQQTNNFDPSMFTKTQNSQQTKFSQEWFASNMQDMQNMQNMQNDMFSMFYGNESTGMKGVFQTAFFTENSNKNNYKKSTASENPFMNFPFMNNNTKNNNTKNNSDSDTENININGQQKEKIYQAYINLKLLYKGGTKTFNISCNNITKLFTIDIKPGWKAGTKILFEDEIIGNIVFIINEKKHDTFERVNNDLIYKHKLSGSGETEINIKTLGKKDLKVSVKGKNKGDTITIPKEGMPIRINKMAAGFGDIIVKFI